MPETHNFIPNNFQNNFQNKTQFSTQNFKEVPLTICHIFDNLPIKHAFTTRFGGISTGAQASMNLDHKHDTVENVYKNHLILANALDYDPKAMVSTHQIHSNIIRIAGENDAGKHLAGPVDWECDGLVTNQPGRPLIVYAADCIPILLYAPDVHAVAALHAGWRGTAADIAALGAARLHELYGADPAGILAAVGPGIGPCCFITDDDVPDAMHTAFGPGVSAFITRTDSPHRYSIDLKAINSWRLQTVGVKPENIAISPECTCCLPDKYWSHRYTRGNRGGQAGIIMLLPR